MKKELYKFGTMAIYLNIIGVIFSGLVFPVLTLLICPQPPWQSAGLFIKSFHPLQTATFFCGFFLITGSLMTFITLFLNTSGTRKYYALSALSINVIFSSIVFLNYIIQTTYVPYLATINPPETSTVLAVFSMSNPGSFAWALEMYGWGGIGLSFLFMAPVFGISKIESKLKLLFWANGICSVGAALMTSIHMKWLFTSAGLVSLVVWNLLVLIIDIYLLKYFNVVNNETASLLRQS